MSRAISGRATLSETTIPITTASARHITNNTARRLPLLRISCSSPWRHSSKFGSCILLSFRSTCSLRAARFVRRQILVELGDLLGVFVDLVVGDLSPDDLAEDRAAVGVDDFSIRSDQLVGEVHADGRVPGRSHDEDLVRPQLHTYPDQSLRPPLDLVLAPVVARPRVATGQH